MTTTTNAEPKTAREFIERGRRRLVDVGWVKGALYRDWDTTYLPHEDPTGYCAGGAILLRDPTDDQPNYFFGWSNEKDPEFRKAQDALARSMGGEDWTDIVAFNNDRGRTKSEVLEAFDRALELV